MLDAKTIDKLKAEHGEIYAVETAGVTIVVRPPSRAAFRRFADRAADSNGRYLAMETLLRDCVVWPTLPELDALLERKPGIAAPIAERLVQLAGAAQEADFRPL